MIGVHIFAGGREEALPSAAGALRQLLFTGGMAEIGGRAAYIVNIALEILVFYHQLGLCQDALVAAGLDDTALVEGQSAEGAGAEATAIAHQAELHFFNGRHTALFGVTGMPGAHIRKFVNRIHFFPGQRLLRRILHHEFLAIGLGQPFGGEGIAVSVLDFEGFGILLFVILQLIKGGQHNGGQTFVQFRGLVHRAVDVGDILGFHTGVQGICQLHDALFAHTVHQDVSLAIQ